MHEAVIQLYRSNTSPPGQLSPLAILLDEAEHSVRAEQESAARRQPAAAPTSQPQLGQPRRLYAYD